MVVIEECQNGSKRNSRDNKNGSGSKRKRSSMSLTDLPPNILVEILTRLPLRTLFVARSVCKTFGFLSTPNPHFINLYTSNAPQILVFQFGGKQSPSSLLHMADEVPVYKNSQLKPLFQLPNMGRTVEQLLQNGQVGDYFIDVNRLCLSNSCNGLLYFVQNGQDDKFLYFLQNGHVNCHRSLVCNPLTGEYFIIDPTIRSDSVMDKSFWLGFSPGTNQYKVLRIYTRRNAAGLHVFAAQVCVIGSDSWRDADNTPLSWDLCQAQHVNGLMYWKDGGLWPRAIISFDFEREKFGEVALPTEFLDERFKTKHETAIGVLGGCLCLSSNNLNARRVDLWVMRKCGNQDSWTKDFVFYTDGPRGWPVYGQFKPVKLLGYGEVLMQWSRNTLVRYDPRTKTLRYFSFDGDFLGHEVVALTPSLVPLKDALKVDKVLTQLWPRYCRVDERGCDRD